MNKISLHQGHKHVTAENIYLISGVNEPYIDKAIPFIESVNANSNVKNIIITLDFLATEAQKKRFQNISFIHLDSTKVEAQNPNTCLQHGGFLPALTNVAEDDIIIFTDADIIFQRAFSSKELEMFSNLKKAEIGVGYNAAPNQTLVQEFQLLEPIIDSDRIPEFFPGAEKFAVYNTGVVIAKKASYQNLYTLYVNEWQKISSTCKHYAKQQWLISYLIQKNFEPLILANELHTHDHHPIDLRINQEYGHKFCVENTPVAFSHHIPDFRDSLAIKKRIHELVRETRKLKRSKNLWQSIAAVSIVVVAYLFIR